MAIARLLRVTVAPTAPSVGGSRRRGQPDGNLGGFILGTVRHSVVAAGNGSFGESFLNPPATMFRNIRRPYKKPAVETIFATEYGCM
jgi:hypothetical protein